MKKRTFLFLTCLLAILVISSSAFAAEITTTLVKERTQILVDNLLANITVGKEGVIIDVNSGEVFFNLGAKDGVKPGMQFDVFQEGQTLKDPTTGKVLGKAKKTVGTIKVKSVEDEFSIASIQVINNAKFQIANGNKIKSKILKTVVLDFTQSTNQKNDENLPKFIQNNIIEGLNNTGKFILAERSEIQKVVSELKLGVSGMIDASSAKQIGKHLGADVVILGFVANLGESYEIAVRMVDVETGTIIGNSSVQLTGDVTKLADNVNSDKTKTQINDDKIVANNPKTTQLKDAFFALYVDDDCNYHHKVTGYLTTDEMINYYQQWHFSNSELNKSYKLVTKIYKPDGKFYSSSNLEINPNQNDWLTSFPFYLKDHDPAKTEGKWKAEIYINGVLASTNEFTIYSSPFSSSLFLRYINDDATYTEEDKTNTFSLSTDTQIIFFTNWDYYNDELNKTYKLEVKLIDPNEKVYDTMKFDSKPTDNKWLVWFPFTASTNMTQGKWRAELYVDGEITNINNFNVTY